MGKLRESYLQIFLFISLFLFVDLRVGCFSCVSLAPLWKPLLLDLKKGMIFFPPNSTVVYVRFTGDLGSLGIVNPAQACYSQTCTPLKRQVFFQSISLRNHDPKERESFNLPLRDLTIFPTLSDWLEWAASLTWTEMLITANLGSQSTL